MFYKTKWLILKLGCWWWSWTWRPHSSWWEQSNMERLPTPSLTVTYVRIWYIYIMPCNYIVHKISYPEVSQNNWLTMLGKQFFNQEWNSTNKQKIEVRKNEGKIRFYWVMWYQIIILNCENLVQPVFQQHY